MLRYLGPQLTIAVVWAASFGTAPAKAAPPPIESKPTVIRLAVDPAAEPRPALQYSFMRPLSERKPGNAAPFYYRAILAYVEYRSRATDGKGRANFDARVEAWAQAPIESFPKDEVRKTFQNFRPFDELREAVSREQCDWDWRLQDIDGIKSFEFILEEVQQARGLARCLAVKARWEIAEGRYADAVETFRIANQFAHDLSNTPILIPGLVGIAIGTVMDDQVHTFIAAKGSPNLYWALTELPRPLIDLRPAVEFEVSFPSRVFPFLKDPEHAQHSPEQWADIVSHAYVTLNRLIADQPRAEHDGWQTRLTATAYALRGYSQAKRDLIAAGYDAAKIEQMPVGQVIAIDEARLSRYIASESLKWCFLPYPEGWRRQKQAESDLIRNHYLGNVGLGISRAIDPSIISREVIPINSLLLPATMGAVDAMIRRDISVAADRAIEAIRMQAAQNAGKLPQSLSDVSVVPVPAHPRFGTPFPYKVEGEKATLEVRRSTQPGEPMQESDYIFEITIAGDRHSSETKAAQ